MTGHDPLKCSKCSKVIKPQGTVGQMVQSGGGFVIGGESFADMLFDGTVCQRCKVVYCLSCSSPGSKCPKCGNTVELLFGDRIPQ